MSPSREITPYLAFLRRYARALAGTQARGDAFVQACLQAIIAQPGVISAELAPKVALFRAFHKVLGGLEVSTEAPAETFTAFERSVGNGTLQGATERRQTLLLCSLEGFSVADTAVILGRGPEDVSQLLRDAIAELKGQAAVDVLIIEDEPIIGMDLQATVEELGHRVSAIAATRNDAVEAARRTLPDIVLADIQLADGSSGIDAVKDILADITAPVIFVTAFPERLLTGERPEPTFLITKPFNSDAVKAAIGQALLIAAEHRH